MYSLPLWSDSMTDCRDTKQSIYKHLCSSKHYNITENAWKNRHFIGVLLGYIGQKKLPFNRKRCPTELGSGTVDSTVTIWFNLKNKTKNVWGVILKAKIVSVSSVQTGPWFTLVLLWPCTPWFFSTLNFALLDSFYCDFNDISIQKFRDS